MITVSNVHNRTWCLLDYFSVINVHHFTEPLQYSYLPAEAPGTEVSEFRFHQPNFLILKILQCSNSQLIVFKTVDGQINVTVYFYSSTGYIKISINGEEITGSCNNNAKNFKCTSYTAAWIGWHDTQLSIGLDHIFNENVVCAVNLEPSILQNLKLMYIRRKRQTANSTVYIIDNSKSPVYT